MTEQPITTEMVRAFMAIKNNAWMEYISNWQGSKAKFFYVNLNGHFNVCYGYDLKYAGDDIEKAVTVYNDL